jgi:hypothetical protein
MCQDLREYNAWIEMVERVLGVYIVTVTVKWKENPASFDKFISCVIKTVVCWRRKYGLIYRRDMV